MSTRIEKDSLGDVHVPSDAYWGSQAERSRQLFRISGLTEHPRMIEAFVHVKRAAAVANTDLGLLDAGMFQGSWRAAIAEHDRLPR